MSDLNSNLVDRLKTNGSLRSPNIEAAFRSVLRETFLPGLRLDEVYSDRSLEIKRAGRQWISSSSMPSTMAIMLGQLELQPGHRVLEIGAGSGYNTGLMAYLVGNEGHVVTMDIEEDLVAGARERLAQAGFGPEHVTVVCGDGGHGAAEYAPYDRIVVTAGARDIMPAWRRQLEHDGRLLLPLDLHGVQQTIAFQNYGDYLTNLSAHACYFMSLRGAYAVHPIQMPKSPKSGFFCECQSSPNSNSSQTYEWTDEQGAEWNTGITLKLADFLYGLRLWLSLNEPDITILKEQNSIINFSLLGGNGREQASGFTLALPHAKGMAVLACRKEALQNQNINQDFFKFLNCEFSLVIHQFGDEAPARRLFEIVQNWVLAGRPLAANMRTRAFASYPGKKQNMRLAANEFEVKQPWTTFVVDWPQ